MATNYSTQAYNSPENYSPLYQQQPSPANSASPTSPRNEHLQYQAPNPHKQLRPLKSPLYVPAALRPTELYPSKPMTPPKSLHGSLDNLQEEGDTVVSEPRFDLDALSSAWLQHEELGDVTGPPTRDHWKPDEASPTCDSPQCRSSFNLFVRKHHCRHCGHIFCATHTPNNIPLDQSAKFHPNGVSSRACETCFRQYQRWDTARSVRRKNSDNSNEDEGDGDSSNLVGEMSGPPTPLAGTPSSHRRMISAGGVRAGQQQKPDPAAAASVPKDWHWSTF